MSAKPSWAAQRPDSVSRRGGMKPTLQAPQKASPPPCRELDNRWLRSGSVLTALCVSFVLQSSLSSNEMMLEICGSMPVSPFKKIGI